MHIKPDIRRLSKLNLDGFSAGGQVLFCPDCDWQAEQPGMAVALSKCPECRSRLNVSTVCDELAAITEAGES